ncbi:MAG: NAD kinase [Streptococcaceae bacterium]|jgi:NAD+ kinase|nr:NAD kinase [Streptococcaceae bacterium]
MKIAICTNESKKSQSVVKELIQKINAQEQLTLDYENPQTVISVGGDGTLLKAFHQYKNKSDSIEFVGVHTGHLGFYADWRDFELDELIVSLCTKERMKVSYPLLEIEVLLNDESKHTYLALNESTIKSVTTTMVCDLSISGELFESFRGDGLAFSTPTGSTAYNKSVGGAVVHPSIPAMQITEIASLNNRIFRTLGSPMIISENEWASIDLKQAESYIVTIDHIVVVRANIQSIRYKIADQKIHFASTKHMHFWNRVRDAFIEEVN